MVVNRVEGMLIFGNHDSEHFLNKMSLKKDTNVGDTSPLIHSVYKSSGPGINGSQDTGSVKY